jgi:hypothetical protein
MYIGTYRFEHLAASVSTSGKAEETLDRVTGQQPGPGQQDGQSDPACLRQRCVKLRLIEQTKAKLQKSGRGPGKRSHALHMQKRGDVAILLCSFLGAPKRGMRAVLRPVLRAVCRHLSKFLSDRPLS